MKREIGFLQKSMAYELSVRCDRFERTANAVIGLASDSEVELIDGWKRDVAEARRDLLEAIGE
jgi:hypothetical protein